MKYKFINTADGSPSIDFFQTNGMSESMHNKVGAFTETLYIYHTAMQITSNNNWPFHVLSVGLGLGYNEILAIGHATKYDLISKTYMESYESEQDLRAPFLNWITNILTPAEQSFYNTYNKILGLVSNHFGLSAEIIMDNMLLLLEEKKWQLHAAVTENTPFKKTFNCILFDAFSSHTSPELWNEDFLIQFIKKAASKQCVLSTYAAKGTLKRALIKNGFTVQLKEGFGGKRQSTLAFIPKTIEFTNF